MTDIPDALLRAYLATSYEAEASTRKITIRIGTSHPALDEVLEAYGVDSWAFVSAANPGSIARSTKENDRDHRRLKAEVTARGLVFFEGKGRPENDDWDPEISLLIIGIPRSEARLLAREYEQLALVFGNRGGSAELVFCTDIGTPTS